MTIKTFKNVIIIMEVLIKKKIFKINKVVSHNNM